MNLFILNRLDKEVIITFVNRLLAAFPTDLQGVILYGSKARGDATNESDIDLLLIFTEVNKILTVQTTGISHDISLAYNVSLSPKLVDVSKWQEMVEGPYPFFNELFKDGLPVYGDPSFFASLVHHDADPLAPIMATA